MKTLIILATLIAVPALAEVEFTLIPDRIEAAATEKAEATAKKEQAEAAKANIAGTGAQAEDSWMTPVRKADKASPSIRNMKGKVDKEVIDGKTNRQSAEDHNSSRSNFRKGDRLDDDTDGDGISDVRRCNTKDDDCNDAGVIDDDENSVRKKAKRRNKRTRK